MLIKKVHILLERDFTSSILMRNYLISDFDGRNIDESGGDSDAAGVIGFELAGLMGIMHGAAFAIGLALQGSLSNFAAGILIVVFKPYKVGDWVGNPGKIW
ncbi:MAG: mechanosensitive ion channel [Calditrichia bacterium]